MPLKVMTLLHSVQQLALLLLIQWVVMPCNGHTLYLILSLFILSCASIISNHSACLISCLYLRLWLSQ